MTKYFYCAINLALNIKQTTHISVYLHGLIFLDFRYLYRDLEEMQCAKINSVSIFVITFLDYNTASLSMAWPPAAQLCISVLTLDLLLCAPGI